MGYKYKFSCRECRLTARVSGGRDRGKYVWWETNYCPTCGELVDVLTNLADLHAEHEGFLDEVPWKFIETISISPGVCPKCHGKQLVLWRKGDPCPRCAGTVDRDEHPLLVD